MAATPVTEMTDRARDVFKMVVENYLGSGQPVGSRTISKLPGINLSPASIRNVMQDLEELGLLSHPHTSAGRIPTEPGLRLFVDGMMQAAEPSLEERAVIEGRLERGGPIEDALAQATAALSGLSSCAGIVLVPKREPVLRQLGFVQLSPTQALVVMVGNDGSVENRVLDLPPGITQSHLTEVGNYVSSRLSGLTLLEAQVRPQIWSGCASCSTNSKERKRSPGSSIARAPVRA
jgi:heat-inducible transcriptional repressor